MASAAGRGGPRTPAVSGSAECGSLTRAGTYGSSPVSRRNAAGICLRRATPSFTRSASLCAFAVRAEIPSETPHLVVRAPGRDQRNDFALAVGQRRVGPGVCPRHGSDSGLPRSRDPFAAGCKPGCNPRSRGTTNGARCGQTLEARRVTVSHPTEPRSPRSSCDDGRRATRRGHRRRRGGDRRRRNRTRARHACWVGDPPGAVRARPRSRLEPRDLADLPPRTTRTSGSSGSPRRRTPLGVSSSTSAENA